jgi:SAM-dependent methyltransferase
MPRPLRAARNLTYRVAVMAAQMDRLEAEFRGRLEEVEGQQERLNEALRGASARLEESSRLLNDKLTAVMDRAETIAELGITIVPPPPGAAPSIVGTAASDAAVNRMCVLCNTSVEAWLPFRGGEVGRPIFLKKVQSIGSIRTRFWCPHCSSTDRERHLRLFIDRWNIMERVRGGAVLHMSPEPGLGGYIESHGLRMYAKGDIAPSAEGVQQIDLQQIPYPDKTFDIVICNHMLEHVDNVQTALREMHRVLKQGGRAICQTPYASRLTKTFEEPLLQSPSDRFFFYGQEDHVRLFGSDIEQHFLAAGFVGRLVPHSEILPDVDPEQLGVNEREPFFDFVRP